MLIYTTVKPRISDTLELQNRVKLVELEDSMKISILKI